MKREWSLGGGQNESAKYLNHGSSGYFGEKKYLVSASWWRKWSDFANFGEL
jgi:hypothetical protein